MWLNINKFKLEKHAYHINWALLLELILNNWLRLDLLTGIDLNALQQIMCGGSQTKRHGWHCMWLRVGWWPQCTSQISYTEDIVNYDTFATRSLSMLVGMNHLVCQPQNRAIFLLLSYHLMSQVWCNPWIKEELLHLKFGIRRRFWNGFPLSLMFGFTETWGK